LDALLERALEGLLGEEKGEGTAPLRAAVRREAVLAHVLARLDGCFASLESRGFAPLEARYLDAWLHSGQRLELEGPEQGGPAPGSPAAAQSEDDEGGNDHSRRAVVTVVGLSPSGFLLGVDDRGARYELTPDGNSLDMMAGLLRRRLKG
jgi:biotin--protein ligase